MIYELQGGTHNDTKESDHNKHKKRKCQRPVQIKTMSALPNIQNKNRIDNV